MMKTSLQVAGRSNCEWQSGEALPDAPGELRGEERAMINITELS